VLDRSSAADGRFVYAVASTGIYCRPTCPARRPRRDNVAFYAGPRDAERAGFRACRRCAPDRAVTPLAERARELIERSPDPPMTVDALARKLGVTRAHLQRAFKRAIGVTPRMYAQRLRAERLRSELRRGTTASRAVFEAGFGSTRAGYAASRSALGMPPGAYRKGGKGMDIEYSIVNSRLGRLLVARTPRGVCAVYPGDSDTALERELAGEFPKATRSRASRPLAEAGAIRDAFEGLPTSVSLDVVGTDFQRRVWAALARIPAGETRSYGEVAKSIGREGAARAVARACATNQVAVIVPCHRVVREDGGLGGYRWGLERKRRLLAGEQSA
jgi:AraC family transcriptional regulator of adaptative response/methylated-DNA-[protein]-cysteine methyltransferase